MRTHAGAGDPYYMADAGIRVLEHGLHSVPEALDRELVIPVACWPAHSCGVVLFLGWCEHDDHEERVAAVTMATFSRTNTGWRPERPWSVDAPVYDPIAGPASVGDLGEQAITAVGGLFSERPLPNRPAIVAHGRVSSLVRELSFIQDEAADRRVLDSHFGFWVVCSRSPSPYRVNAIAAGGSVLGSVSGPATTQRAGEPRIAWT